ncbi:MAG: signal peptidase II [Alphaproteobacteria bacterium]
MIYLVSLAVIFLDQLTKNIILNEMSTSRIIEVFPCFNLVLTYNTGVSFSLLSGNNPYILACFALAVCAGLVWWMMREPVVGIRVGLALIIGGAVSNVIDRLLYGGVVDFLDFYVASYHWPAFNVADSAICIGAAVILWYSFIKGNKK